MYFRGMSSFEAIYENISGSSSFRYLCVFNAIKIPMLNIKYPATPSMHQHSGRCILVQFPELAEHV